MYKIYIMYYIVYIYILYCLYTYECVYIYIYMYICVNLYTVYPWTPSHTRQIGRSTMACLGRSKFCERHLTLALGVDDLNQTRPLCHCANHTDKNTHFTHIPMSMDWSKVKSSPETMDIPIQYGAFRLKPPLKSLDNGG